MDHTTDRIPFTLPNGLPSTAMIMLVGLPDGRTLVTCANEHQDEAPVNMAIEQLFHAVCNRHHLAPARVVWVEYTSGTLEIAAGRVGGWELVTWTGGIGQKPKWQQMTDEIWNGLGVGEPPPSPW